MSHNRFHILDSRYKLPSRKYFSDVVLPHMYSTTREKVTEQLKHVPFFSATTDLWSSRTMQPYLSLTVHFVTEEWKLESVCLQTSFFPNDHTGEEIAQGLREGFDSWNLSEDRLVCITTDSGTNMLKALRLNEWPNLQCFGHKLHNAIENGVKHEQRIDHAIASCKKIVSSFSYSWKRRRELDSLQTELNLPRHQLITESPTRWGSRQAMVERVLEQESAITRVLGSEKKTRHLVPSMQTIDILESVNKAIKPLQDFTDALSGESYVTVSVIKPILTMFKSSLLKPQDDDTNLTKKIKGNILNYMTEKYSDPVNDELLDMASLMDPRFRTAYINPDKVEHIKGRAITELLSLMPTEPGRAVQVRQEEEERAAADPSVALSDPVPKKKRLLSSFFHKKVTPSLSQEQRIRTELATYLLIPEVSEDADPLQWWKGHAETFPSLSKLAKKYLSIPATSAPSERLFSVGGNIVTCHRASLNPDSVDRLVFLSRNLKM